MEASLTLDAWPETSAGTTLRKSATAPVYLSSPVWQSSAFQWAGASRQSRVCQDREIAEWCITIATLTEGRLKQSNNAAHHVTGKPGQTQHLYNFLPQLLKTIVLATSKEVHSHIARDIVLERAFTRDIVLDGDCRILLDYLLGHRSLSTSLLPRTVSKSLVAGSRMSRLWFSESLE